jgi:hypothetical protein
VCVAGTAALSALIFWKILQSTQSIMLSAFASAAIFGVMAWFYIGVGEQVEPSRKIESFAARALIVYAAAFATWAIAFAAVLALNGDKDVAYGIAARAGAVAAILSFCLVAYDAYLSDPEDPAPEKK